jgi:hypothetical protein
VPATAGLNFVPGDVVPNGVTVALPTAGANPGQIDLYYWTPTPDATLHVIADSVGYTISTSLADVVKRVVTLEKIDAESPERVIWVAVDGTGDYLKLSDAFAAIGTTLDAATAPNPCLIRFEPGTHTETAVALKSFVDVEVFGQGITACACACACASGGTRNYGVYNFASFSTIRNSSITGTINIFNYGAPPSAKVADTVLADPVSGSGFVYWGVHRIVRCGG